jgi:hypothetical protein
MYVETSKIDVIVLIGNVIMCHSQTDLLFSESVRRYWEFNTKDNKEI